MTSYRSEHGNKEISERSLNRALYSTVHNAAHSTLHSTRSSSSLDVMPFIEDFKISDAKAVTDLSVVTLRMFQGVYTHAQQIRSSLRINNAGDSEIFANVIIYRPESEGGPIFVDGPESFFLADKRKKLWASEGGALYTKSDGFELPYQGIQVPVLIDPSVPSKGYMVFHPETGMPLETFAIEEREKALNLWERYLEQIIQKEISEGKSGWIDYARNLLNIDLNNGAGLRELASHELCMFYPQNHDDGNAIPVRRVVINGVFSHRNITASKWPNVRRSTQGVRRFRFF